MIFSGNAEKGVPDFWLTAMKTNEILAGEVTIFYKLWSILDITHTRVLCYILYWLWNYDMLFPWIRSRSVMKRLLSSSKISNGVELMTQRVLSWNSSLILIHFSRILSLQKHITWLMKMILYWRKQLGNFISIVLLKCFVSSFFESLLMLGYSIGRRLNGILGKAWRIRSWRRNQKRDPRMPNPSQKLRIVQASLAFLALHRSLRMMMKLMKIL